MPLQVKPTAQLAQQLSQELARQLAQGFALQKQGELAKAQAIYEQILQTDPEHFDALQLLGALYSKGQKNQEALDFFDRALRIKKNNAILFYNRGNVLQRLKQFEDALSSYDQAIALKPDYANAYSNRGNVLQELKQFEAALSNYDQAIQLKPDYADAYSNRSKALKSLKQFEAALRSYDQAIALKPDQAESELYFANRGALYKEMGYLQPGIADLKQACQRRFKKLREQPDFPLEEITKPMSVPDAATALLEFKQFMDGLQVPFFLIKGTLLGIYRDGEQLPYDKDIDLGLLWQTDRQNLFEQFQNSSTFRVADPVDGDLQKITWNIVLEHVATEVVLDLFFVKSEGPAAWFGFDHLPEPFLWKFSAFELAPMPYRGHVFQAPKHPEQFLSEIYGPQWRIPDPYFNSVVSARNIEPKSRIIAWFYAYDRLYEQLVEGNWKKVLGCCEEIKAFETEPWLVDLSAWAKQQSKHAAFK